MSGETIIARLVRVLAERLALDAPGDDVDLFESGLLDSLSFAELLVALEREFRIAIPVEDIDVERFRTIHALTDMVTCAMATAAPAVSRS
jgi:methoxymalonate biosynthesis acyl carrier protein